MARTSRGNLAYRAGLPSALQVVAQCRESGVEPVERGQSRDPIRGCSTTNVIKARVWDDTHTWHGGPVIRNPPLQDDRHGHVAVRRSID